MSILGVGRRANNSSLYKNQLLTTCNTGPLNCEHGSEPSAFIKREEFLD